MKKIFEQHLKKHRKSRRYAAILVFLSLLVIIGVNWGLHGNGISITENEFYDGQEKTETASVQPRNMDENTDNFSDGSEEQPSDINEDTNTADTDKNLENNTSAEESENKPDNTGEDKTENKSDDTDEGETENKSDDTSGEESENKPDDTADEFGDDSDGTTEITGDQSDDSTENTSDDTQGDTQLQLNNYITGVTFEKTENGSWVPVSGDMTVNNHEQLRLKLNYHIPAGTVNGPQDEISYQLPGGIKLTENLVGDIKDTNGDTIGSFAIDTSGRVVLSFSADFAQGQAFDGYFQFQAKADFSEAGEGGQVRFGTSGTLTIKRNEDISVTKSVGNLVGDDDGNSYVDYTVTVSTVNGTGNEVTITDCLNKASKVVNDKITAQYVTDTITVRKRDAQGNSVTLSESDYRMTVVNTETDMPQIIIDQLPALEAGEKYQLCYKVKVTPDQFKGSDGSGTGYGRVYNYVKAESGSISGEKYDKITYPDRISKSGTYDSHTGLITWTIVTNNPNPSSSFDGYILKDILPEGTEIRGDVSVTTSAGKSFTITGEQLLNGYEFKNFQSKQYTFTFRTTVPENFSDGNYAVTNRATIEKGGAVFGAEGTVNIPVGRWGIQKTYEGKETDSDGITRAYWNAFVTNSTGGRVLVFKDSFRDAVDDQNNTLSDSHYGIVSELQNAIADGLTLTLTDGSSIGYPGNENYITLTCYDKDGKEIPVSDGSTHVKSFTITVNLNAEGAENIKAVKFFSLNHYPSHVDLSVIGMGRTAEYENHAAVWDNGKIMVEDSAEFTHKNMNRLDKKVSTDGGRTYTDGGSVEYDDVIPKDDKHLYYQLEIQTEAEETSDIILQDVLPLYTQKGQYDKVEFYLDDSKNDKIGSFTLDQGVMHFTIRNYNTDNRQHKITIKYGLKIGEKWNDASTVKVDYTNCVTWGDTTVSTTTTVQRQPLKIQKAGVQIKESGKNTNRVRYTVVLNPTGETLNNGTDMTLTDAMTITQGSSIAVDSSSIALYYYDYENGSIQLTQEVDHSLYQVLTPQGGESVRVTIPDRTACVLVYECIVDPGKVITPEVGNTAVLAGKWSSAVQNKVEQASASAGAGNGKFILTKTDSYNGKILEGARFTIYCYNKTDSRWESLGEKSTENGILSMTITQSGKNTLNADTLYKIVETQAPDNYTLDPSPLYYIWNTSGETSDEAYLSATGLSNPSDAVTIRDGSTEGESAESEIIRKEDISFNDSNSLTTVNVKNSYNNLKVSKIWLDEKNRPMSEAPVVKIQVQLYRYKTASDTSEPDLTTKEKVGEAIELNSDNNWSYTWEGENVVPEKDTNGQDYYYIVEEVDPESNWKVTYRNNDGIQTGEIAIINTVCNTYELPETGSTGTAPYTASGLALMISSSLLYGYKKRKRRADVG